MPNPNPPFSILEYQSRLEKTRLAMQKAELEVLLLTDPSNMAWLTGYDGWSFYVHQGVLVTLDNDPIWWGRGIDLAGANRTVWMNDAQNSGYEDAYVQNPKRHPMSDLAEILRDLSVSNKTLGVELDNYYFSAKAHQTLEAEGIKTQDATGLVNWLRAKKSEAEIEYMRRAGKIVTRMHQTILEAAKPGMRKNDLVAEIYRTGIQGADGHWGDYPSIFPMAPSGLEATAAHLTWDDAPLEKDIGTFFEIAGAYRRYQCPQSRTLFLGSVPERYQKAEEAVQDATDAVLALAKPGVLCEDLANAFDTTLGKHGFEKDNRCGYSIGLSYPPDWGERTMSLRAGDTTLLEAGMTFHFMPALWLDDGGIETTEPILITEQGCEKICGTPSGLMVEP